MTNGPGAWSGSHRPFVIRHSSLPSTFPLCIKWAMSNQTSRKKKSGKAVSVVTGGAGFLGSHLVDLLLGRGHRVIAIDNFITGTVDNIAHLAGNQDFKFIQQDVTEFLFLQE